MEEKKNAVAGGMRRGPVGLWWSRSYEFCLERYQFLAALDRKPRTLAPGPGPEFKQESSGFFQTRQLAGRLGAHRQRLDWRHADRSCGLMAPGSGAEWAEPACQLKARLQMHPSLPFNPTPQTQKLARLKRGIKILPVCLPEPLH